MTSFLYISVLYFNPQDLEQLREEGQPKVQEVISQSEAVLPNTAPPGKDLIARDIEALQIDWSTFLQQLVQVCTVIYYFDARV